MKEKKGQNDPLETQCKVRHKSANTQANNNDLGEVLEQMAKEYPTPEYPLQPLNAQEPCQSDAGAADEQLHQASGETPTQPNCEPDFDFSSVDNPKQNPNVGLFTVKSANQWIDEASSRPMPCKLFGQLWYEGEICILFSFSNLGKSILAVQIADAISRGANTLGMENEAQAQKVLYFDFELSDKQFEGRYMSDNGKHYRFSENLMRIEINPDVDNYPEGCKVEEYVKISLQQVVQATNAKVIIIDNITWLGKENEKAQDALPLMKWLKSFGRKFGLSILVLAHTPKDRITSSKPITMNDCFGSSMILNFCDAMFAIGKSSKGAQMRYLVELKQRNVPHRYTADNVIVCEVAKPDDFVMFRFLEYGFESEHLRQITAEDRSDMIERAKELSAKGKSIRAIGHELGVSPGTVHNYLKK